MKFSIRTIIIFVILNLAAANLAPAQDASEVKTVTISGLVGLGGVTMQGLPGNVVTDSKGHYSAVVETGWTGTVRPRRRGYAFVPADRTYNNVTSDQDEQNYASKIITITISGNAGRGGVVMYGLPGNPPTSEGGFYAVTVDYGWTGNVKPEKEGYNFEPPSLAYSNAVSDLANQNYRPKIITFTISGEVLKDDKGVSGVELNGFPGNPITGRDGKYNVHVDYGWSSVVVPEKEGYTFLPPQKEYSRLSSNQLNDRYVAKPKMFTISGRILVAGTPLEGVLLSANNGGGSSITDAQGRYSVEVSYGWTGEISMSKQGLVFEPPSTSYRNVTENFDQGQPVPQQSNPYRENVRSPQRGLPKPNQMTIGKVSDRKVMLRWKICE
jgi:hypothetical protein